MPKIRVYVDTSVFGGTQEVEFMAPSCALFAKANEGMFRLLISPTTLRELEVAPRPVLRVYEELPPEIVEHLAITPDMEALAEEYIKAGALGKASAVDALHVAVATVALADLIVSWNFKHLVNYGKIRMFNGVNALRGYRNIDIRSPWEVRYGEGKEI
jgi:hypothetical protein